MDVSFNPLLSQILLDLVPLFRMDCKYVPDMISVLYYGQYHIRVVHLGQIPLCYPLTVLYHPVNMF